MKNPLVSVIITTKNEEKNIENCLKSIISQTYKNLEIIVVDNNSTDATVQISKKYTSSVYNWGPERSAQRNFGAKKAHGGYLLFLDADMKLTKKVISECVQLMNNEIGGIFIPEESVGTSFWAKAKKLERSFYIGHHEIEAARFYSKKIFTKMNGFDESLTGPEDWDLSKRVEKKYQMGNAHQVILHNEGNLSFSETVRKKYYYSKKIKKYTKKHSPQNSFPSEINPLSRFILFFSNPKKLFSDPFLGLGMLFMKMSEYTAGALGYLFSS